MAKSTWKPIPVDRRTMEISQYWSNTARVIRALQRADGWLTAGEVFDALGVGADDDTARNTLQVTLGRLAKIGVVVAERMRGDRSNRWYRIAPRYARVKRIRRLNERGRAAFVVNV